MYLLLNFNFRLVLRQAWGEMAGGGEFERGEMVGGKCPEGNVRREKAGGIVWGDLLDSFPSNCISHIVNQNYLFGSNHCNYYNHNTNPTDCHASGAYAP